MSPSELREQAQKRISNLSTDRLRVADDFLAYLEQRESCEATDELLAKPGLMRQLEDADKEARQGQTKDWRDLRSDV